MIPLAIEAAIHRIAKHALPLGLKTNAEALPWTKTSRATFALLRVAKRCVFVTCHHVLRELEELQRLDRAAQMVAYLTSSPTLVELNGFRLIAKDERRLDVAIFAGLEDDVELPGMKFIDYDSSWLADPAPGEAVSIVGYPAANVAVTDRRATFGYMHLGLRISAVSERQITLANEYGDRQFIDYHIPQRQGINLGGLSGSPALVLRDHQYRFVGVVKECSDSDRDQTIIISRLDCIKPDGTLDHGRIPC